MASDTPKTRHRPLIPFDYGTTKSDDATFYSDNKIFEGFKNVSIRKQLMSMAGSFQITLTDKWKEQGEEFDLKPGARIHCHVGSEAVFEGYVDRYAINITPGSRNITISGRDRTADLIDCSVTGPSEYNNLGLKEIATLLCDPFDIKVLNPFGVSLGSPFEKFTIRQGETVFEALNRAAKQREIILLTSTHGNLILDKRGERRAGTELVEGINVTLTGVTFDNSERFSEYTTKGQQPGIIAGLDDATKSKAQAFDLGVDRFRPTIIISEQSSDNDASQKRANFESSYKTAKAFSCSASVINWKKEDGKIWVPNEIVHLTAPSEGIKDDFLISSVSYKLDDNGRSVDIELIRKDAFAFEAIKTKSSDPLDAFGGEF